MDFFDLIRIRESCRDFSDRPVEKDTLLHCIEAACLAPSACNSQPWSYVVVNRPSISPKLSKYLQETGINRFSERCQAFILVFEEPAVLFAGSEKTVTSQRYAQMDVGMSVMQLCLAAADIGLATCIMGVFNEAGIKQMLELETDAVMRLVIGVGYPQSPIPRVKKRKSLEEAAVYLGE